jgi:hypothetical protein
MFAGELLGARLTTRAPHVKMRYQTLKIGCETLQGPAIANMKVVITIESADAALSATFGRNRR